jgi:hypothetical protein
MGFLGFLKNVLYAAIKVIATCLVIWLAAVPITGRDMVKANLGIPTLVSLILLIVVEYLLMTFVYSKRGRR